jgi:hypothetical protein
VQPSVEVVRDFAAVLGDRFTVDAPGFEFWLEQHNERAIPQPVDIRDFDATFRDFFPPLFWTKCSELRDADEPSTDWSLTAPRYWQALLYVTRIK